MARTYQADMSRLRSLSQIGSALIDYALSLTPNNELRGGYALWVPYPSNFFGFRVQRRVQNIRFSVRGTPNEFLILPDLPLSWGRGHAYSEFVLATPNQLYAACSYIRRAHELFRLGRNRFGRAA